MSNLDAYCHSRVCATHGLPFHRGNLTCWLTDDPAATASSTPSLTTLPLAEDFVRMSDPCALRLDGSVECIPTSAAFPSVHPAKVEGRYELLSCSM